MIALLLGIAAAWWLIADGFDRLESWTQARIKHRADEEAADEEWLAIISRKV